VQVFRQLQGLEFERRPSKRPSTRHENAPLRFSNRLTENVG
jgi:hypothetical protein